MDYTWIIVTIVLPLVTGVSGWFVGKRKNAADASKVEAEARKVHLQNIDHDMEIYKRMLDDAKAMVNDQLNSIGLLRERVNQLESKVLHLELENQNLRRMKR